MPSPLFVAAVQPSHAFLKPNLKLNIPHTNANSLLPPPMFSNSFTPLPRTEPSEMVAAYGKDSTVKSEHLNPERSRSDVAASAYCAGVSR
eukprot:scaffold255865_cov14-Tisochrysis_lutea.AAC.1